jgi:hypothetical protein
MGGMKRRMAVWAMAGFLVACGWIVYAFATLPDYEPPANVTNRTVQVLAYLTCPILAAGVRFYWVPFTNAATYSLIGLLFQLVRHKSN